MVVQTVIGVLNILLEGVRSSIWIDVNNVYSQKVINFPIHLSTVYSYDICNKGGSNLAGAFTFDNDTLTLVTDYRNESGWKVTIRGHI